MDPAGVGGTQSKVRRERPPVPGLSVLAAGLTGIGVVVAVLSTLQVAQQPPSLRAWFVLALIVVARTFVVTPPKPLPTLSVSPWLAYAVAVICGPAPATLAIAAAELYAAWRRKVKPSLDASFDVVEPAVSLWIASQLFAVVSAAAGAHPSARAVSQLLPPLLMAVSYFGIHSVLTTTATSFRSGESWWSSWRTDAIGHALSSYAILWLATSVGEFSVVAMLVATIVSVPLAGLSYLGYRHFVRFKAETKYHTDELERLYHGAIEALAVAVDAKDQITHGHIRRVQRHTLALARRLGVDDPIELKAMEAASLLHDIGKLAVPDYVLNKPGSLTRAELLTMKQHVVKGALILEAIGFPFPVVPIVRGHHEQWNGRGYPDGLAGTHIPLGARILSVVDCFDALTSDRPYRRRLTDESAIDILNERKEVFYDPAVVEAFIALIPQLRLEDAEVETNSPLHSMEEALNETAQDAVEGTRALKVDLTTPDAVGKLLRVRINALVPHAEFCLFVPDPAGTRLWPIHASAALRPSVMAMQVHAGEGLAGWVLVNRHTIINSPPDLDFEQAAAELELKRCVSTPVFAFGTMAGVLNVYTRKSAGFTETEVRIVGAIAQELGLEFTRHDRTLTYDITPLDDEEPLANVG